MPTERGVRQPLGKAYEQRWSSSVTSICAGWLLIAAITVLNLLFRTMTRTICSPLRTMFSLYSCERV